MCGIAGLVAAGSSSGLNLSNVLSRMNRRLRHRGPDDCGIWVDNERQLGLAHTRLSILDLSPLGHQPMESACGRYVISYNGEIYNFQLLRRKLESEAASFRSHSDTEVLLESIVAFGLDRTLDLLDGMFAFALWDKRNAVLSLARDRLGEKPLYFGYAASGSFIFGSELRALRAYQGLVPSISRKAASLYMRHGYVSGPHSIYEGIFKLRPGHFLQVSLEQIRSKCELSPRAYWNAREQFQAALDTPFPGSVDDAQVQLEELVNASVVHRQAADVPVGAFLSGGVDSSLISAVMQRQGGRQIKTYSVGFEDEKYDESRFAEKVAGYLGTQHETMIVSASDLLNVVANVPVTYDEPFADSSQIPTMLLCEFARREVTVAVTGDGGDELFAGYDHYQWMRRLWRAVGWMPQAARLSVFGRLSRLSVDALKRTLFPFQRVLPGRLRGSHGAYRLRRIFELASQGTLNSAYRNLVSDCRNPDDYLTEGTDPGDLAFLQKQPTSASTIAWLTFLDAGQYLPDDLLTKVDRASMAVSLECRAPLLDHKIAEFAWRLDDKHRIAQNDGKHVLRQLLYSYVPRELVDRPKMGFRVPIESWLRGPLKAWAEDILNPRSLTRQGIFDPTLVSETWSEHQSGSRNWEHRLWSILMFQKWLESHEE